jgi:hypothetical protein
MIIYLYSTYNTVLFKVSRTLHETSPILVLKLNFLLSFITIHIHMVYMYISLFIYK